MIYLLAFALGVVVGTVAGAALGRRKPVAVALTEVEWRSDDVWVIPYDVKTATIMSGWEEIPRA